ncbi:hypothetical protein [Candidatus Leptofilum sp.]|uniref:hypothetical protein n=1 Tax=Candidatus Leptofilum sp. TaxID=3241576 RepID=UPI003B5942CF
MSSPEDTSGIHNEQNDVSEVDSSIPSLLPIEPETTRDLRSEPESTEHVVEPSQTHILLSPSFQSTEIRAYQYGETIFPVGNPSWSHDGTFVAFMREGSIWIINPESWQDPKVACELDPFNGSLSDLLWSSNDSKIIFISPRFCSPDEECIQKHALLQCDLQTGEVSIFPNLEEHNPISVFDWQDERLLLLLDKHLVIYNINTGSWEEIDLPGFNPENYYRTLRFVDEQHVLYMTDSDEPIIQIVNLETLLTTELMPADEVGNTNLQHPRVFSVELSPNNRWVSWLVRREPSNQQSRSELAVKLYDLESGETYILMDNDQLNDLGIRALSSPSWSPTSDRLVFLANHQLWILELNIEGENH